MIHIDCRGTVGHIKEFDNQRGARCESLVVETEDGWIQFCFGDEFARPAWLVPGYRGRLDFGIRAVVHNGAFLWVGSVVPVTSRQSNAPVALEVGS